MKRHPEDGFELADPYPMSGATVAAFRSLIRVLCPAAPAPTLPDLEERIELHARRMLQYMPRAVALGFVLSVRLLEWSPVWRFVALRRLHGLPRERAERLLTEMGASRSALVRTMVIAVRGIVLSTFYDQDEIHRGMQWNPLPFLTERVELRERLLATPTLVRPQTPAAFEEGAAP